MVCVLTLAVVVVAWIGIQEWASPPRLAPFEENRAEYEHLADLTRLHYRYEWLGVKRGTTPREALRLAYDLGVSEAIVTDQAVVILRPRYGNESVLAQVSPVTPPSTFAKWGYVDDGWYRIPRGVDPVGR